MGKRTDDDEPQEKTTVVKGDTFRNRLDAAAKAPPCLIMLEGPAGYVGKQWMIDKSDIIIGRSMNSTIFIDDRSVSRSHAKLTLTSGDVYILDLESSNHTVVNDDALPPLSANETEQQRPGENR